MLRELTEFPFYEYVDGPPDEDCDDYIGGCA